MRRNPPKKPSTFTQDFRAEYELEQREHFRRRFVACCAVMGAIYVALLIFQLIAVAVDPQDFSATGLFRFLARSTNAFIYGGLLAFVLTRKRAPDRGRLVRFLSVAFFITAVLMALPAQEIARMLSPGGTGGGSIGPGLPWLLQITFFHVVITAIVPWTVRECLRPMIALLALNGVLVLFSGDPFWVKVAAIPAAGLAAMPGAFFAWWRTSRFKDNFVHRMLRDRYTEMRRELVDARRIHEALFPPMFPDGAVRMEYLYEPMRQIGGDYLYASRPAPDAPLSVVIVDVTGHGVPAALTVNRLHGELERLFGERPDIAPGEVLRALNHYIHLTMATHSVYATAFCLRADPAGDALIYASGGHPPAFHRSVDGRIDALESTSFVLGATHGADFAPNERTLRFGPGDSLLVYTDGATEARDQQGRMLRVDGVMRILASAPRSSSNGAGAWARSLLAAVDAHRFGPLQDDTLVVEVHRPLRTA